MSRSNFIIVPPEPKPELPPAESLYQYPLGTVIGTPDGYLWVITDDYNHDGERYFRRTGPATEGEERMSTITEWTHDE